MKEHIYISAVMYMESLNEEFKSKIKDLDRILNRDFENVDMIIVNNGSERMELRKEDTSFKELSSELVFVNLPWKQDVEKAMLAGIDASVGDFVFEIENPLYDYPDNIFLKLYRKAVDEGCDIYSAQLSRQSFVSKLYYRFLNSVSYLSIDIHAEDIRIVSRRALNRVRDSNHKVKYRKILYALCGLAKGTMIIETDNAHRPRSRGFFDRIDMGINILVLFSYIGTHISIIFSAIFIALFLLFAVYSIYYYFAFGNVAEGWTTLVILISFGFSGIFLILGILGKYLALLIIEKQQKPYIVKDIKRIEKDD